jgi:hypothetical protein
MIMKGDWVQQTGAGHHNPLLPLSLTSYEARSLIPLSIWMAEMGRFEKHRSWLVEDEGLLHD